MQKNAFFFKLLGVSPMVVTDVVSGCKKCVLKNVREWQREMNGSKAKAKAKSIGDSDDGGWVPRTDLGFPSHIRSVLSSGGEHSESAGLERHQHAVKKFLMGSPYRGLLVFHGLGSGKTCAAIAAMEALMQDSGRKVFVVLPASLQTNFEEEVEKCASDVKVAKDSITYVRMNGVRVVTDLNRKQSRKGVDAKEMAIDGESVHGSVIIVDESHNLIGYKVNGGKKGVALYDVIYGARDAKVICLTGTAVVNDPFEIGTMINMIAGPQYRIAIKSPLLHADDMRRSLSDDLEVQSYSVDGTKVSIVPVEEGYLRKSKRSRVIVRAEAPDLSKPPHDSLRRRLRESLDAFTSSMTSSSIHPETREDFNALFVHEATSFLKNPALFQRANVGMVSFYRMSEEEKAKKGFPAVYDDTVVRLEMTGVMIERYTEQRTVEIARDKAKAARSRATGQDSKGSFRAATRMICNFAFPKRTDRKFSNTPDDDDLPVADLKSVMAKLVKNGHLKDDSLRELSPKMHAIMDHISESKGSSLVYSNFRALEGVGIFAKVLEAAGYRRLSLGPNGSPVAKGTDKIYHEFAGASEDPEMIRVFNGENKGWNKKRKGRPPVDVILITAAGAEGISLKGVRNVHIMEPHWNEVRIQQVIGRAARLGSHGHLPESERNVTVRRYVMSFPPSAIAKLQTQIRRADKGKTTDEHIAGIAELKSVVSEGFVRSLQEVSVDCGMYPVRPEKCYGEGAPGNRKLLLVERDGETLLYDPAQRKFFSHEDFVKNRTLVEK